MRRSCSSSALFPSKACGALLPPYGYRLHLPPGQGPASFICQQLRRFPFIPGNDRHIRSARRGYGDVVRAAGLRGHATPEGTAAFHQRYTTPHSAHHPPSRANVAASCPYASERRLGSKLPFRLVPRTQWSLAPFGFGGYRVSARTSSHRSALYLLAILLALDLVVIVTLHFLLLLACRRHCRLHGPYLTRLVCGVQEEGHSIGLQRGGHELDLQRWRLRAALWPGGARVGRQGGHQARGSPFFFLFLSLSSFFRHSSSSLLVHHHHHDRRRHRR